MDVAVTGGGMTYIASNTFGLSVANVTNPSVPVIVGSSNTPFFGQAIAVSGIRAIVSELTPEGLVCLCVLNLTDPTQPQVLGELPTTIPATISGTGYMGVALNSSGTLAVAAMGMAGIWMVDLTNPAVPTLLGTYDTPGTAYAVALNSTATLAYVADGGGDLQIVNLTNPSHPTLAGSLSLAGTPVDIDVAGTTAYLANQNGTLVVVNVSNPAAPVFKGQVTLSGYGYYVAVEGTQAAVLSSNPTTNSFLDVVDVSNPVSPVRTGSVAVGLPSTVNGVDLANGRAYVALESEGLKIYDVSISTLSLQGIINDSFEGRSIAKAGTVVVVVGKDIPTSTILLQVFDLTDPTQPQVLGELPTTIPATISGTGYMGVALNSSGTLAVAAMGMAGIWMVDLTNPAVPTLLGTYDTPGTAYAVALNSTATLAYVADGGGDLQIVNLTNPSHPTLAGSLSLAGTPVDIDVAGTTAYLANQNGTLVVVNVSNPAAPVFKGQVTLSGYGYYVAVEGTQAVVLSSNPTTNSFLDVVDVSNPVSPVRTSSVAVGLPSIVKGVDLANAQAYVALDTDGLKIYDISSSGNPVLLGAGYSVGKAKDVVGDGSLACVADYPAIISIIDLAPAL
jgi:hypothetical protein